MLWVARDEAKVGGHMGLFDKKPAKDKRGRWSITRQNGVNDDPVHYLLPSQCEFTLEPGAGPFRIRVHLQNTTLCDPGP